MERLLDVGNDVDYAVFHCFASFFIEPRCVLRQGEGILHPCVETAARTIHEDEPQVLDVEGRVVDAFPSPFFILTWAFFIPCACTFITEEEANLVGFDDPNLG